LDHVQNNLIFPACQYLLPKKLMEVFTVNDFQNDIQQFSASQFQAGEMTPWNQQGQNPAGQFPGQFPGLNPADPSRLCVGLGFGFCGGFGGGFCSGFGGGFCGGFERCGGFCGGFERCGGFCGGFERCGGFHHCGGFCHQRCR
jgi:hypothetical protein